MKNFLYSFLKLTVAFFLTGTVFVNASESLYAGSKAINVNIVGPDTVCVFDVSTYSIAISGSAYNWTLTGPGYPEPNGNELTVEWYATGTATISVEIKDSFGQVIYIDNKNVVIVETPEPRIETSFDSECGEIIVIDSGVGYERGNIFESKCFSVCDSTRVTYYAVYEPGSQISWNVTGAEWWQDFGDSIWVFWGEPGTGFVELTESNAYGCTGVRKECVTIIERPDAVIITDPAAANGIVFACRDQGVQFINGSTENFSVHWDFGDGSYSYEENPVHRYEQTGNYIVTLTIENECYCSDVAQIQIFVDTGRVIDISCVGPVCLGDTIEYSTSSNCASYTWSVQYGSILGPSDQATVQVVWNNPNNGVGLLTLQGGNCQGICPLPNTVRIPVVGGVIPIEGPDVVCPGSIAHYSIPELPGADIQWAVDNGSILHNEGNEVTVQWGSLNTLSSISVTYSLLKSCSGYSSKFISIRPPVEINGDEEACMATTSNYTATATQSNSYEWEVQLSDGTLILPPAPDDNTYSVNWSSLSPGDYMVIARELAGESCKDRDTVFVTLYPTPPLVAGINGSTETCPFDVNNYSADPTSSDYILEWQITNGTPATSGGDQISVKWGATGPYVVKVRQVRKGEPHCEGSFLSLNVSAVDLSGLPGISGPDQVCENTRTTYSSSVEADLFEWSLTPEEFGSIIDGHLSNTVHIQWKSVDQVQTATLVLRFNYCNTEIYDTLIVTISPVPELAIIAPLESCEGDQVTFQSSLTGDQYIWSFGDGTPDVITSNPSYNHSYQKDSVYPVTLTVVNPVNCTDTVYASHSITINPRPVAWLTPSENARVRCTDPYTLYVSVQEEAGAIYNYDWYKNGVSMNYHQKTYTIPPPGVAESNNYYVVVTDNNTGCSEQTETLNITHYCGTGGGGNDTTSTGDPCDGVSCSVIVSDSLVAPACGERYYFASTGPGCSLWAWNVYSPQFPGGVKTFYQVNPLHIEFEASGIYKIVPVLQTGNNSGSGYCYVTAESAAFIDVVPVYADFKVEYDCYPGDFFNVSFFDLSDYVDDHVIVSWEWFLNGQSVSTQENFSMPLAGGQADTVTLVISDGHGHSCEKTRIILVPESISASFTLNKSSLCEDELLIGSNTSAGDIINSVWDMGASYGIIQSHDLKTSFDKASLSDVNVQLIVSDKYGCSDQASRSVLVYANTIDGQARLLDTTICAGESTLAYHRNDFYDSYFWEPLLEWGVSVTVSQSGRYKVTVRDAGCVAKFQTRPLHVLSVPLVRIEGELDICEGESTLLNGYIGAGYSYQWLLDGAAYASGASAGFGPASGSYAIELIVSDNATGCSASSGIYTLTVHPRPQNLSILSDPDPPCEGAPVRFTASASGAVSYHWNVGHRGPVLIATEPRGYAVEALSQYGCSSEATVFLHPLPDFSSIELGCIEVCEEDLPLGLAGIPGYFISYKWYRDGMLIEEGSGLMDSLRIDAAGLYYLVATTQYGCSDSSEIIEVISKDCRGSNWPACGNISLNSLDISGCDSSDAYGNRVYNLTLQYVNSSGFDYLVKEIRVIDGTGRATLNLPVLPLASQSALGYFTDFPPYESDICLAFTLENESTGEICVDTVCGPVEYCDSAALSCDSVSFSFASAVCDSVVGTTAYMRIMTTAVNRNTQSMWIRSLTVQTGQINYTQSEILPGINNYVWTYMVPAPAPDSLCIDIAFGLNDWPDDSLCTQTICPDLPLCDSAVPGPGCAFDIVADSIYCIGPLHGSSSYQYYFDLNIVNSGTAVYEVFLFGDPGAVSHVDAPLIVPGTNRITGIFRASGNLEADSICILFRFRDTLSGEIQSCRRCFAVDSCRTMNCKMSLADPFVLRCEGIDGDGDYIYSFSGSVNYSGTDNKYFYLTSSYGVSIDLNPTRLIQGINVVTGTFKAYAPLPSDSICFDLISVRDSSQADAGTCLLTICMPVPVCKDSLQTCSFVQQAYFQSLYCISAGNGEEDIYFEIVLKTLPAPYAYRAVANSGILSNLNPDRLPAGVVRISGMGRHVSNTVDPYCIRLLLSDSTGRTCELLVCGTIDSCGSPANKRLLMKEDEGAGASLQVYPVPARQRISVSYDPGTQSGKKEETLRISDMLGRTVYQRTLSEAGTLEIDVQEWSAGIYFIFVEGRGLSRQIVIIR